MGMGWLGKVIGGTIGFAMGGPLGAIAGAVFGHAFDKNGDRLLRSEASRGRLSDLEASQFAFFIGAFSMLAKLSQSDGRISKEEVESVRRFMAQDLNLNPQSQQIAMNIFQAAMDSPGTFEEFTSQFYQQFKFQPQLLDLMMDIMLRVSLADGVLNESERRLIMAAKEIFHFSDAKYHAIESRYILAADKYYKILGSNRNDSDDQIKSRYRKLVKEYHPDKIASKGLPEEFTTLAEEKFREIQEAYDRIRKERGLK
jgi:DnaJ like chaperone protein